MPRGHTKHSHDVTVRLCGSQRRQTVDVIENEDRWCFTVFDNVK